MRKIQALLLTIIFMAAVAMADTTNVGSVNAVGYAKINVPAGKFVLTAIPLYAFDSTVDAIFQGQLTGTTDEDSADKIYVYESGGYTKYWKVIDDVGQAGALAGHMVDAALNIATNVHLFPGQAFWIKSAASTDQVVTLTGEVPNESQATNTLEGYTYSAIGFPFPVEQSLGDNTNLRLSGAHGDWDEALADNIYFYDPVAGAYTKYWLVIDDPGAGVLAGKWVDMGNNLCTQKFAYGSGVWYLSKTNTFNWIESRPYPSVSGN